MAARLTAIAALAAAAITLTAVASASPAPVKQRVVITQKDGAGFVLTPPTSGPIKPDTGVASFCCWTRRSMTRDGEDIELNNPQMTLTGRRGTIVTRNQIEWIAIPDGQSVFTGTWKVVSGTGAYAGLTGGGRAAGLSLANGNTKSQFEGFLSLK